MTQKFLCLLLRGNIVSQSDYSTKASACCLKSVHPLNGHISVYMMQIICGFITNTIATTVSPGDPSKRCSSWQIAASGPFSTLTAATISELSAPTHTHLCRPLSLPVFKAKIKADAYAQPPAFNQQPLERHDPLHLHWHTLQSSILLSLLGL